MKRRIVLLGPPASGKGSQAQLISDKYGIPAVSTGHLLRDEAEANSELGRQALAYTLKGQLAPDELVLAVVKNWLAFGKRDFVFDGFPRNLDQAKLLEPLLASAELPLEIVIFLRCHLSTIEQRILGRVVCSHCKLTFQASAIGEVCPSCGGALSRRSDDTLEILEQRMLQYAEKTAPLIDFYQKQGLLYEIDGGEEAEEVFAAVETLLLA